MIQDLVRITLPCLALAACTADLFVPESTTTEVADNAACSADGYFCVHVAASSFEGALTIETLYDVPVQGLASKVYEVRGPGDEARAREAYYRADALEAPHTKVLVTVDGDDAQLLPTLWDLTNGRLLASGVPFSRRRFAVLDLGFRHGDCDARNCDEPCTYCDPATPERCAPVEGRCSLEGTCEPPSNVACAPAQVEGWNEPPTRGATYVIDSLAIAPRDRGFDLDGDCRQDGCIDNRLGVLGPAINDQLRQYLLGGEGRTIIELAGLNDDYRGEDESLTMKVYPATDADDPIFPANDFGIPPGETTCCEFRLDAFGFTGVPTQARLRTPARIERGRLRTLAPLPVVLGATTVDLELRLRAEQSTWTFRLPLERDGLEDGLVGAVVPLSVLANLCPSAGLCRALGTDCPNPEAVMLLDVVAATQGPPDIDVDGDGLECLLDTDGDGRIDRCCDGEADSCTTCSRPVAPADANDPSSCAFRPEMADGYSVALEFTAVPATIVGGGLTPPGG